MYPFCTSVNSRIFFFRQLTADVLLHIRLNWKSKVVSLICTLCMRNHIEIKFSTCRLQPAGQAPVPPGYGAPRSWPACTGGKCQPATVGLVTLTLEFVESLYQLIIAIDYHLKYRIIYLLNGVNVLCHITCLVYLLNKLTN